MTDEQIRQMLAEAIRKAGSLRKWSKNAGVSTTYTWQVMHGVRPGPGVLAALGLERVETIRKIGK